MATTINILGETAKEQWLNAIRLYGIVIESNVAHVRGVLQGIGVEEGMDELYAASRALTDFEDEMTRLVEGVME